MKAAFSHRYGPASTISVEEAPVPVPGPGELLVRVAAAGVTTADWRLRASAFPAWSWLPGRLMFGLRRPKQPVRGTDFAGEVVAAGPGAPRVAPGTAVFGVVPEGGAHAEYVRVPATAPLALRPAALDAADAAAVPFGALNALHFLREVARVRAGQRVLILGASGNVGGYAVQIARLLGAHVTAVGGPAAQDRLRALGAEEVIDYTRTDPTAGPASHDVVLDTAGIATFARAARVLTPDGLFVPLEFRAADIVRALTRRLRRGPRIALAIGTETQAGLDWVAARLAEGSLRPVIGARLPFAQVVEAHARVAGRHAGGPVVLEMGTAAATAAAG